MGSIIVTDALSKTYHSHNRTVQAVQDLSLQVEPGELFGLFGPNGAGKSTIVRMLTTLLLPTSGTASVGGFDVVRQELQVRACVGLVTADERSFYGRLTAKQNLAFYAAMQNVPRRQIAHRVSAVLELFGLVLEADAPAQSLSTGQKQRLNMARALVHDPQILFLDEPTKSMDVQTSDFVKQLIKEELVGRQGKTVMYISHELYEMDNFCDRVLILSQGRAQVVGSPAELAARLPRRALFRIVVEGDGEAIARAWRRMPEVELVQEVSRGMNATVFDVGLAEGKSVEGKSADGNSAAWQHVVNCVADCGGRLESFNRVDDESLRRIVAHFSSAQ